MPASVAAVPFVPASRLPALPGKAPRLKELGPGEFPDMPENVASVRYKLVETHRGHKFPHQVTATTDPAELAGESWYQVRGTAADAARAAHSLATYANEPDHGDNTRALTSVSVLQAGDGVWNLARNHFLYGAGDGMDAIISMPLDRVAQADLDVSVPYPREWGAPVDVKVRFNDPSVAMVVGRDWYAAREGVSL